MKRCPNCGQFCGDITGKPGPLHGSTEFADCPESGRQYAKQLRAKADGLHKIACEYEVELKNNERTTNK